MSFFRYNPGSAQSYHASRVIWSLIGLLLLSLVGVIGYRVIEGWSWVDCIYMVFITFSTVGFREVHTMGDGGRLWTSFLILLGVGLVGFFLGNLMESSLHSNLLGIRKKRIMTNKIDSMNLHYIVCGFGRVGQEVVAELVAKHQEVVVIDLEPPIEQLEELRIPYLTGNAQSEEILKAAGIDRARGLIAAMDSDTGNVFTILTARQLKPELQLIARASERETSRKLRMVGADRVVSPYVISGRRMAAMAVQPDVVDFLDYFTQPLEDISLEIGSVDVQDGSELAGKSLEEAELRKRCGAMVLAVRQEGGMHFNPDADTKLESGSSLMILGTADQFTRLEAMAKG